MQRNIELTKKAHLYQSQYDFAERKYRFGRKEVLLG